MEVELFERNFSVVTFQFEKMGLQKNIERWMESLEKNKTEKTGCLPDGYKVQFDQHTVYGSSNYSNCMEQTLFLLNMSETCRFSLNCTINNFFLPPSLSSQMIGVGDSINSVAQFLGVETSSGQPASLSRLSSNVSRMCDFDLVQFDSHYHQSPLRWCFDSSFLVNFYQSGLKFNDTNELFWLSQIEGLEIVWDVGQNFLFSFKFFKTFLFTNRLFFDGWLFLLSLGKFCFGQFRTKS